MDEYAHIPVLAVGVVVVVAFVVVAVAVDAAFMPLLSSSLFYYRYCSGCDKLSPSPWPVRAMRWPEYRELFARL